MSSSTNSSAGFPASADDALLMLLAVREQARDLEYQTARSQDEEWRLSAESAARFVNSHVYIDEPQGAA